MPVYNGERYIVESIESILSQTCGDFELIISDNASTDNTGDICRRFARADARVQYVRQTTNIGVSRNYNRVFRRATGKYFKWASSNDVCAPELLAACIEVLERTPGAALCFAKTRRFGDINGEVTSEPFELTQRLASDRFAQAVESFCENNVYGGVFRTKALRATSLERPYPGGDLVLLAELALHGQFLLIPRVLHFRRMSPDSATPQRASDQLWAMFNPGRRGRFRHLNMRRYAGYAHALFRGPLTVRDKILTAALVARRMYWANGLKSIASHVRNDLMN